MKLLPINNKTVLTDSKVLSVVTKWYDHLKWLLTKMGESQKSLSPCRVQAGSSEGVTNHPPPHSAIDSTPAKKRFLLKAIEESTSSEDSDANCRQAMRHRSNSQRSDIDTSILDSSTELDLALTQRLMSELERLLDVWNSLTVSLYNYISILMLYLLICSL